MGLAAKNSGDREDEMKYSDLTKLASPRKMIATITSAPSTVISCLADVAANTSTECGVVIGTTSRMNGDHLASVQARTVSVYYNGYAEAYPDEYYVCDDAGYYGGPATETDNGHVYVNAEYVDGEHRLDVATGEMIDAGVIL